MSSTSSRTGGFTISFLALMLGLALLGANALAQSISQASKTASVVNAPDDGVIRPFQVHVPESALVDLRNRVLATRWPDKETVSDQSQGVLGPGSFARYWMHNGFVNFNDEKMSKSVGNVFLVSDMVQRYDGESIRLFMVQTHYRSPINFEVIEKDGKPQFPGLDEAERRLDYFYSTLARIDDAAPGDAGAGAVIPEAEKLIPGVHAAMEDDFNTAVAIAELGEAARAANKLLDDPKAVAKDVRRRSLARLGSDLRAAAMGALGLLGQSPREFLHGRRARLAAVRGVDVAKVDARIAERDAARKERDFARADALRAELRELGVEIMDTPRGADWRLND